MKCQKIVLQTRGFVNTGQPELDPRMCLTASLSAPLASPKATALGGRSPRGAGMWGREAPCTSVPNPERCCCQSLETPQCCWCLPARAKQGASMSGDALHQVGLHGVLLPCKASLWAAPKLGLYQDHA